MSDYRDVFSSTASQDVTAQAVFTDRLGERQAFAAALAAMREAAPGDVAEATAPRRNVLSFYGVGGIGKTALSRELERLALEQEDIAVVRFDFAEISAADIEPIVLAVRAGAGGLGQRPIAFDLALGRYWEQAHPGEALETYVASSGVLRRLGRTLGLAEHVNEAVLEVGQALGSSSTAVNAGVSAVRRVALSIRGESERRHAVQGCPYLAALLAAPVDSELVTYLPALLAWDLTQSKGGTLVVFLDTYEEVQAAGRDVERRLQRLVHLMPNVLFVVTGRNRLDWADENLMGELDHVGPTVWPHLAHGATSEPRSHLVGDLSPEDCDAYLRERLRRGKEAAIPGEIRRAIVSASAGLPLYLDLSVTLYCSMTVHGAAADISDFGLPFAALVSRVMRDLGATERAILRGVSLLSAFDVDLARTAGRGASAGMAEQLCNRPFVVSSPDQALPYSLHAALRESIRHGTDSSGDAWAEQDWVESADRLLASLEGRGATEHDPPALASFVRQGLEVAAGAGRQPTWQVEQARRLHRLGRLDALQIEDVPGEPTTASEALAAALATLRADVAAAPRLARLSFLLREQLLPPTAVPWFALKRASALIDLGELARADRAYETLPALPPDLVPDASAMRAVLLVKYGRFEDATEGLPLTPDSGRTLGGVARSNAQWDLAMKGYRRAASAAGDDVGLQALFRTCLALVTSWSSVDGGRAAAEAQHYAEDLGGWSLAAAHVAEALAAAGFDRERVRVALKRSTEIAADYGGWDNLVDRLLAEAFEAAVLGEDGRLEGIARDLDLELVRSASYPHVRDIVAWWRGQRPATQVQWVGGPDEARTRWLETVDRRRRAAGR